MPLSESYGKLRFMFALLGVVNAFPAERAVFLRETQDKLYHPAAFYLAKVFIAIHLLLQILFVFALFAGQARWS